jgi:creatinine amidohydrolase
MDVNITRMDAFTYRGLIAERNPVMLIPVGAIEQHGPHMPLAVDALLATKMAELTAERVNAEQVNALVGPTVTTGYKSQQRAGGGNHIVGSIGFDAATVTGICRTFVREFARHGLTRLCFVNGHYENYQFLFEGVDLGVREVTNAGGQVPSVMMLSYWDFVSDDVIAQLYPDGFPGWSVEHGGVMETSLMLEYFPELVHMDRVMDLPAADLPLYDLLPVDPSITPESGCLSSAKPSAAEKGKVLAGSIVAGMAGAIQERFGAA